jgi:hypothetical protein
VGSTIQLISYSQTGGQAELYDIMKSGSGLSSKLTGSITVIDLSAGSSPGSYKASTAGRHILFLVSGLIISNAIAIDVKSGFQVGGQTGGLTGGQTGGPTGGLTGGQTGGLTGGPIGGSIDEDWNSLGGGTIFIDSTYGGFMSETGSGPQI